MYSVDLLGDEFESSDHGRRFLWPSKLKGSKRIILYNKITKFLSRNLERSPEMLLLNLSIRTYRECLLL